MCNQGVLSCCRGDVNVVCCQGDEGGPVLCYDGTRFAVQGIIPFNLFGINNQGYNPYVTDVAQYEAWIRNTIATYN